MIKINGSNDVVMIMMVFWSKSIENIVVGVNIRFDLIICEVYWVG